MKIDPSTAARTSPLVVNCFYFGAGRGECHHPANPSRQCCLSGCAMLAADFRENSRALLNAAAARVGQPELAGGGQGEKFF